MEKVTALDEHGLVTSPGPHVSLLRKVFNICGCLLAIPIYWAMAIHCKFPVTLDIMVTILLAELNRFLNEGRRIKFYTEQARPREKFDSEKVDPERQAPPASLNCMAAVVGWREDPALFTRALDSYKNTRNCTFMMVGIDGDEREDEAMVEVFEKVYPHHSKVIHVPEPLGDIAERMLAKSISMRESYGESADLAACQEIALQHCVSLARTILEQEKISFGGPNAIRQICIRQKHMHKKGIMFTTYIFSLVIADMLGIEFLWSSDSDTLVLPDSLERTASAIAADPRIGGASSGLIVHNEDETATTQLAATVYWGELYLTRSAPAPTATSDCQSGPSTLFRLAALPPILVPWYMQTLMGKRMIINEDRHLTTNLLSRGWRVVFASDVLAATDTPTTLPRWIMQQVRWARATHIESLLQPRVYLMSNPLLFYGMAKREFGPFIAFFTVICFFFLSNDLFALSAKDFILRTLISATYNLMRNPQRLSRRALLWVLPGMIFYYIPLPAVHVWSLMTMTADGWGTSMRASGERARKSSVRKAWWEAGFFVAWMGIVFGSLMKCVATVYEFDALHRPVAILLSIFAGAFWAWSVTINKISS